jgi:hypothetical protein
VGMKTPRQYSSHNQNALIDILCSFPQGMFLALMAIECGVVLRVEVWGDVPVA